jgi:GPH family glycoside/pentoside/hexuronide:cation symporter
MLFRQDIDRKKSAVMTFLISNPIILLLSLFPIYIIVYGDRSTFIFTSLITAGIMAVCLALTIPGITESDEIKQRFLQGYRVNEEKIPFLKICGICIRNKNFMVSLISFALCYIALMLYVASYIYFFKDVLELPLTYALLPILGSFIAMAISMPLWNRLSRKHDHSRIYMIGIILSAILHLPFLWITTIEEYTILSILRGVATSCFFFMLQPISADVYDEITLKCERHLEATLHGLRNIIFRSSAIFIAIILGWIHIATMYNPNPDAQQPPMAVWGIRVHTGLIPAIFFIAAFVMMLFYDLKGEKSLVTKKMLHEKGL